MYSPYKAVWRIPKLILIAYKFFMVKINTVKKFLLFRMECIIDGGGIFDDWCI